MYNQLEALGEHKPSPSLCDNK